MFSWHSWREPLLAPFGGVVLGFLFSDRRPGSASIRYAVAVLNPDLATASAGRSCLR